LQLWSCLLSTQVVHKHPIICTFPPGLLCCGAAAVHHHHACRTEAAPQLDIAAATLHGFCADEVRPLLERLEMMSLAKPDALRDLQLLFGGEVPSEPALAARVPEAKKAFELARMVPAAEAGAEDDAATQLSQADSSASSCSNGDEAAQVAGAAHAAAGSAEPELMYVQRQAATSGPASLLPQSLQERLPSIAVINSQQQLQQLVGQLQQHQVRCPLL
jgi:hypothetical protein